MGGRFLGRASYRGRRRTEFEEEIIRQKKVWGTVFSREKTTYSGVFRKRLLEIWREKPREKDSDHGGKLFPGQIIWGHWEKK